MKARFIYSTVSGRGLKPAQVDFIVSELKKVYDEVDVHPMPSVE